jgi:hypothetical protein
MSEARVIIAVEESLEAAESVRSALTEFLDQWDLAERYEARARKVDGLWRVSLVDHEPDTPLPVRALRLIEELRKRSRSL